MLSSSPSAPSCSSSSSSSSSLLPLHGIRVLDLSRLLPGPYCSGVFVELGAEVIKVEDQQGDSSRYWEPLAIDGNSTFFHLLNRGKLSVQLDLKKEKEKQQFLSLLPSTDILIESFRPGVMEKLGLSPRFLLSLFPHLIICSISGMGQDGPLRLRAHHDLNSTAVSGLLSVTSTPSLLPLQVADLAAAAFPAAIQILAALRRKEKTGEGALIDVSMAENCYSLVPVPLSKAAIREKKKEEEREGESEEKRVQISGGVDLLSGGSVCYSVYRTKDGFIAVAALEFNYWKQFVEELGVGELVNKQFAKGKEGEEARNLLQSVLEKKSNNEWREWLKSRDYMCEVVEELEGIADRNEQFKARGVEVEIQVQGENNENQLLRLPKFPIRMNGVEPVKKRGPKLGEHNHQILNELRCKL